MNRRNSPAAIGRFFMSEKWTAIRRSPKNRMAARVSRESSRPNTCTLSAEPPAIDQSKSKIVLPS